MNTAKRTLDQVLKELDTRGHLLSRFLQEIDSQIQYAARSLESRKVHRAPPGIR